MAKKIKGKDGKVYKQHKPFYKKIWFWLLVLITVGIAANLNNDKAPSASNNGTSEKEEQPKANESKQSPEELYDNILQDYTIKIKEAAPKLVDEYNAEFPNNENGLEGLAELSNSKILKLAEISNDGISEMAEIHLTKGSGTYEEYEDWAGKLTQVYMDEAQQITDAYMSSAQ